MFWQKTPSTFSDVKTFGGTKGFYIGSELGQNVVGLSQPSCIELLYPHHTALKWTCSKEQQ